MDEYDPGVVRSWKRRQVNPREVERVTAEVAAEFGVDPRDIRGTAKAKGKITPARRIAWRRLARPNISVASISRAWPCHHTAILEALGRRKNRRIVVCN